MKSPLACALRHLRVWPPLSALVACAIAAAPAVAAPDTAPRDRGVVTRVVDGDTLVVSLAPGRAEHVRLIGIDTPESKPNKRARLQAGRAAASEAAIIAMGKEAFRNTERLAPPGTGVSLEYDVEKRDRYRRILAYVYLPDGRMLNEEIVSGGFANLLTMPPNVRHVDRLRKALSESRTAQRGLWRSSPGW